MLTKRAMLVRNNGLEVLILLMYNKQYLMFLNIQFHKLLQSFLSIITFMEKIAKLTYRNQQQSHRNSICQRDQEITTAYRAPRRIVFLREAASPANGRTLKHLSYRKLLNLCTLVAYVLNNLSIYKMIFVITQ